MCAESIGNLCGILVVSSYGKGNITNVEDLSVVISLHDLLIRKVIVDHDSVGLNSLVVSIFNGISVVVSVSLKNDLLECNELILTVIVLILVLVVIACDTELEGATCYDGCRLLSPVGTVSDNDLLTKRNECVACKIKNKLIIVDLTLKLYGDLFLIERVNSNVIDGSITFLSCTCVFDIKEKRCCCI